LSKRLKRVRSTLSQKQRNTVQADLLPLDTNSLKKSEIWDSDVVIESGDTVLTVNLIQVQEPAVTSPAQVNQATVEELIEHLPSVAKLIATEYQDVFSVSCLRRPECCILSKD
jgi:hypothetical protein